MLMNATPLNTCGSADHTWHRRQFLGGMFAAGLPLVAGQVALANDAPAAATLRHDGRRALFIWLAGGSSQFETWDPKPGRATGGPFRAIPTKVAGYRVCELMPKLATMIDKLAVIRSLDTQISEHGQAAELLSTGRPKEAALTHPEIGVVLANELRVRDSLLPDYVSFFLTSEGRRRPPTGYLGGGHEPLALEANARPEHIALPEQLSPDDHQRREDLRRVWSEKFAQRRAGGELVSGYNSAYQKVRGLMQSDHLFDLEREPAKVRDRYGKTPFGQQALIARRLLEAGVPMVKVARGFWDSHHDNFESHRELVPDFDHVLSTLLADLDERGLLDSTLVIVLSEFGRTPKINQDVGRDHYAAAWSCALAGAGIKRGCIYGRTDDDGQAVVDGRANASDLAATIFKAAGLNPWKHYEVGLRPVPISKEDARPIDDVLA
jgi:hypothetical protein